MNKKEQDPQVEDWSHAMENLLNTPLQTDQWHEALGRVYSHPMTFKLIEHMASQKSGVRNFISGNSVKYDKALNAPVGDLSYIEIRGPKSVIPGVRRSLGTLYLYHMLYSSGGPFATTNSEEERRIARERIKWEIVGTERVLIELGYGFGVLAVNMKVIVDRNRT